MGNVKNSDYYYLVLLKNRVSGFVIEKESLRL